MCTFRLSGCGVETPASGAAGASHDKPENSKRAHFRPPALQTTKIPRTDQQEREEKKENCGGRREKKRDILGPPTLQPPTLRGARLRCPTLRDPTFSRFGPPPFGAPPFVVQKFNIQKFAEVELAELEKKTGPKSKIGRSRPRSNHQHPHTQK